ncbi:phage tail tape measure protein, partial [Jatrophihabitans sp.]|uniref:phage tail tape measure protein n=1 Tax=Jatrophihabitans sp. TaxID=1932789 RepID=UPI0030C67606|nr:phage tail tape measure protein [Jatrophihabitans sp.]
MSLDLGALVGSVVLETASFDRNYTRVVRQMGDLGATAEKSAAGTATLDEALAGVGASAGAATTGLGRVTQASRTSTTAEQRAAVAAERHATAVAQVAGTMETLAAASPKLQQAELRLVAAQDRLNAAQESGTATTRQLASAQAGLIGAQRAVLAAEEASAESATRWSGALGGTLKMAGELGLVLGGIEIAKKAFEFVAAGKDLTESLNGVQAASHATTAEMAGVRAEAIRLGKDLTVPGATAVDAADAILDLVKAGIQLPKAMQAARPALLLASATQTTMADTARVLGDTLDLFSLSGDHAAHVANVLAASTFGASHDLLGLFDALKQSAPTAQALGISFDDVVTALTELAKHGISATQGGAGLKTMLTSLAKETPASTKALQDLGVVAFNSQGSFVGFPKLFDQLHTAQKRFGPDTQQFVHDLNAAFGVRSQSVAALFAKEGVGAYNEVAARLASGDLQNYANLMNRGAAAGFRQLDKEFTAAGISIYQEFEPAITGAIMWVGTNLPKAAHDAQSALQPLEHFVGGALTIGWNLFAGALHASWNVLEPVLHLVEDLRTPLGAVAVLAAGAWLGFQGARAAGLLVEQLIVMVRNVPAAMVAMVASARESAAGYIASMGAIGSSSKTAAVATTGAMTDIEIEAAAMSGTIVAEGEAASVGWAGLLGPLGAVAVGIGLLITMFHHSSSASKEATDAAKAYTDALKTGDSTDLTDSIVTQLADNGVPDNIAKINRLLGTTAFSGQQFVDAIQKGSPALATLQTRLQAVIDANNAGEQRAAQMQGANVSQIDKMRGKLTAASKLLKDLNTQYNALSKTAESDLLNTATFAGASSSIDKVSQSTQVGSQAAQQYAEMLGIAVDKNGIAAVSSKILAAAVSEVSGAYAGASQTADAFLGALNTFAQSGGTAADRAAIIGATLKAANGDALNFAAQMNAAAVADDALTSDMASNAKSKKVSIKSFAASIIDLKTGTIDYSKSAAAPLISDLQSIQTAAMNAAQAQYQHGLSTMSAKDAADAAYKTYVSQTQGTLIDEASKLGLTKDQAKKLADQYFGMPKSVKTLIEQEGANPVVTVLNQIGTQLSYLTHKPWVPTVAVHDSATSQIDSIRNALDALHSKSINISFTGNGVERNGKIVARANGGGVPDGMFVVGERGPELGMKSGNRVDIISNPQSAALIAATGMSVPGFASGTYTVGGVKYDSKTAAENAEARIVASEKSAASKLAPDLVALVAAIAKSTAALTSAGKTLTANLKAAGASTATLKRLSTSIGVLGALAAKRDAVAAQLGTKSTTGTTAYDRLATAQQNYASEKSTVQ